MVSAAVGVSTSVFSLAAATLVRGRVGVGVRVRFRVRVRVKVNARARVRVDRIEARLAERREFRDVRREGDPPLARSQRRKPGEYIASRL